MKNTYKIPEGCTSISIEQIGNKIVTEFETGFKKGDVISFTILSEWLAICESPSKYYCVCNKEGGVLMCITDKLSGEEDHRLATQSEKQLLFDVLARAGKQWNAETLQIEDLKVEPKVGDCVKLAYSDGAKVYAKIKSSNNEIIFADFWYSTTRGIKTDGTFISYDSIEILTPTQFQSEVKALGLEYDFKNDTFKEMKWEPKKGEEFYSFNGRKMVTEKWAGHYMDLERLDIGNCFKTKSECESAIEKIKEILKSK